MSLPCTFCNSIGLCVCGSVVCPIIANADQNEGSDNRLYDFTPDCPLAHSTLTALVLAYSVKSINIILTDKSNVLFALCYYLY